jgi:hypothetical protein
LNVTFFWALDESFALLLPNDRALFPAALHLPHDEQHEGDREQNRGVGEKEGPHGLSEIGLALTLTPASISSLASPSY